MTWLINQLILLIKKLFKQRAMLMKHLLPNLVFTALIFISAMNNSSAKPLIVGSEQDYPPFALGLTNTTADGFTVQLWQAVATEAQLDWTIQVLPFHEVLQEFKAGHIDILNNLAQSPQRREFAEFTVPHVIVQGGIFVRQNNSDIQNETDLANKKIIVLNADLAHDYALKKGWQAQLTLVNTAEEGFKLLDTGKYDAFLLSQLTGKQTLQKLKLKTIEVLPIKVGFSQKFSFAVRKGDAELLAKINEGLALTKVNGVYDRLYEKWFGVYEELALRPLLLKYISPVIVFFLIIIGFIFYNYTLERKKAFRILQQSEAHFRNTFANAPIGIVNIDIQGNFISVNQTFCDFLGYSSHELLTINIADVSVEYDKNNYLILIKKLFAGDIDEFNFEKHYVRKDKSLIWGSLSVRLNTNLDGSTYYAIATIENIDERKQAEFALTQSELQLKLVLEGGHLGFWDWNIATGKVQRNEIWAKMLGYSHAEIEHTSKEWLDFIHADDRDRAWTSIYEVITDNSPYHEIEYRMLHKDGSIRWILDRACIVQRDSDNKPLRMSGTHTDITNLKLLETQLRRSETRFKSIIDISPIPMALSNAIGQITYLNPAFIHTFGYELIDVPTIDTWWQRAYPDANYRQTIMTLWFEQINTSPPPYYSFTCLESHIYCKNDTLKIVSASASTVGEERLVVLYDITTLKQNEAELRIAATVFESAEGMIISDARGIILNANQAFSDITGYHRAEIIGQYPYILNSHRHDKHFYSELWQQMSNTWFWQGEMWLRRKNTILFPIWLTITAVKSNNDNTVTHYVATLNDITERKTTEEYINRLAFYDSLTQLPNRRLLQERLKQAIELTERNNAQMAVLMLDLDKFKAVNDTLGHGAGDALLIKVGERIKTCLRSSDTVARLGGDEFVILMQPLAHINAIASLAKTIINQLSQAFILNETNTVYIGASIGIAIYPLHGHSVELLMDNADAALYLAKEQGRGCFAYFCEELTYLAKQRVALEARLRLAIEKEEFYMYFQPQISLITGAIIGAEALIRWYDKANNCYITPNDFIPLAEETGLIVEIGRWVLNETCKIGKRWLMQGLPPITLAVNVSPYQFRRDDINALVVNALEQSGFPAQYLELEITESGLMDNQQYALTILTNLHNQGVKLAIDDFGTGYSSLAYLKLFPLDVLKIDKSFIDDIPDSENDRTITATIIAMGHHLGFKVLAEGVETPAQLDFLTSHGCDIYQGYLYSKPINEMAFRQLLATAMGQSSKVDL